MADLYIPERALLILKPIGMQPKRLMNYQGLSLKTFNLLRYMTASALPKSFTLRTLDFLSREKDIKR